ncbi:MAG: hypothetical protein KJ064_03385 [Anaerolineae bacterium]|nr:hypothetical protein [Anaerolineae bacterium]
MDDLLQGYLRTGIVQFGRFQQPDGTFWPVKTNFLLLPSYPDLLKATALALAPLAQQTRCDRLLTTRATIPLGAVLSVESGIPLTYPYGEPQKITNAFVIEGAYDVGHPTTLLTDVLTHAADAHAILKPARQVGLHIHDVLCVFTLGQRGVQTLQADGLTVHALLDFGEAVEGLRSRGQITPRWHDALIMWLENL